MDNIIEKLKKNKNIIKLLKSFEEDFSRVYNSLKGDEKRAMLGVKDTIFRKWLYSPIIDTTYVTPAYLINDMVMEQGVNGIVLIPHIKVVALDNGCLKFKRQWIEYSTETHPVIEDLNNLILHCEPTLIIEEEYPYIINGVQGLVEKLNFESNYYLKFLIDIALELGILEELKAIGCKCYRPSKGYGEFMAKENKEKLKLITGISIAMANKELQGKLNHKGKDIVEGFLQEFVTIEDFEPYIRSLENIHKVEFKEFLSCLNNRERAQAFKEMGGITTEEISSVIARAEFGIMMDRGVSNLLGYYLGIIMPTYPNMFLIDIFIKTYLGAQDEQMILSSVFEGEVCHHLTTLGGEILGTYDKEQLRDNFTTLNLRYMGRLIDEYIASKEVFVKCGFDGSILKCVENLNSALEDFDNRMDQEY